MFAQVSEAIDNAANIEQLGVIGILALVVFAVVFGFLTERIVSGKQAQRDRDERDAALAENKRLRGMYDRVIVLAAQASADAAEEVRRLTERHE